jgi:hypothetical protein
LSAAARSDQVGERRQGRRGPDHWARGPWLTAPGATTYPPSVAVLVSLTM